MKIALPTMVLWMAVSTQAAAGIAGGMSLDASSNMLLRPAGQSGVISRLYGSAGHSFGDVYVSYGVDAGMVEHYDGIQFHRHTGGVSYLPYSTTTAAVSLELDGTLTRYDDITLLRGYSHLSGGVWVKKYLGVSSLLRGQLRLSGRSYPDFGNEDYRQVDTYLRFDRFFSNGTTLRGQVDAGYRGYPNLEGRPAAFLFILTGRIARSLTPDWGMWVEVSFRRLQTDEVVGSAAIVDRVFLDDRYRSELAGFTAHTTRLFGRSGRVDVEMYTRRRAYPGEVTFPYWYLPVDGWKEWEYGAEIGVGFDPAFMPDMLHPKVTMYYMDVRASTDAMSFDALGCSVDLRIY